MGDVTDGSGFLNEHALAGYVSVSGSGESGAVATRHVAEAGLTLKSTELLVLLSSAGQGLTVMEHPAQDIAHPIALNVMKAKSVRFIVGGDRVQVTASFFQRKAEPSLRFLS